MPKKFKFLEHTADIKFKVYGSNIEKIFENTALAMSEYLSEERNARDKIQKKIEISAKNTESLLYSFIDEILFLLDSESFLVKNAKVKISGEKLTAILKGDKAERYSINHIKAATYAEMKIKENLKGWEAIVVLDV